MSDSGYVKLHRSMTGSVAMSDDWLCRLWIACLLRTNWRPGVFKGMPIEAGQFAFAERLWSESLGVSRGKLRRGLARLEDENQLTVEANRYFTVVTVCKWGTYQDCDPADGPQTVPRTGPRVVPRTGPQTVPDRRREEHKKERRKEEQEESASAESPSVDCDDFVKVWNESRFVPCRKLTPKRKTALRARLAEPDWHENWQQALTQAGRSSFLRGNNDRGWKADINWFLKPDSVNQILEGKYDDRAASAGQSSPARLVAEPGEFDFSAAVIDLREGPDGPDSPA